MERYVKVIRQIVAAIRQVRSDKIKSGMHFTVLGAFLAHMQIRFGGPSRGPEPRKISS
jgi:hypothetical protein